MGTVVSFINFKGGVGKTTLCVEIASSLASKFNERVLLIDLDPQTNATLSLISEQEWIDHANENGTLLNFFQACYEGKEFDIKDIIIKNPVNHPNLKNLDLLPSHIELFGMDLKMATRYGFGDIRAKLFIKKALSAIENNYEYILIDCPPNLYLATQNGLFASNNYVIIALAEYLSTLGIAHIIKSVGQIFEDANNLLRSLSTEQSLICPKLIGIIFNRVRYRTGGTSSEERTMRRIREEYGDLVFNITIPQSDKIAVRAEYQIPISISGYAADREYQKRMEEAAHEFYDRLTKPD